MNEDLIYYTKYVKDLADSKKDELFLNSGEKHAEVVLSQIFQSSEKIVRIFAGNLIRFGDKSRYINSLMSFLDQDGTELKILLNKYNTNCMDEMKKYDLFHILWYYSDKKNKNITIKYSNQTVYSNGNPVHFTTGDDHMFRIETDLEERRAKCNFNSPKVVEKANTLFDNVFQESNDLNLGKVLYGNA